ncbi:creatininase family protein [Candidatus Bathyarchaeota archaeon]|nr:creatininase family protein [Candidatus Bathyarchaeota archaeon]
MKGHEYRERGYDKAVLAVGSTEYHGDHLPYGTDTLVAEHLASEVAARVEGLLMLPTIPVGMSAHYSSFPIAISLSTETLMRVLTEVFDSLDKHGLRRLLIVNGHDGNIPAIDAATREYRTLHPGFKIAVLEAWWVAAGELVPPGTFEVWGGLGHAGEGETSMMLRVDPSLVDMGRARGVVPDLPAHVEVKWTFDELTPYGATGDPSKATRRKGELMHDALVDLLVDFVKKMDERGWET